MLQWQSRPEPVFTEIVDASLETAIDIVADLQFNLGSGQAFLPEGLERVWTIFGPRELQAQLGKLLAAHRSPKLFLPTDYHFLVLYEVLNYWIEIHNDRVAFERRPLECGEFLIAEIDCNFIVEKYFPDEDFLFEPKTLDGLTSEQKEHLGLNPENFGVTHGLKPHPQELELLETDDCAEPEGESFYQRGLPYPWSLDWII